MKNISHILTTPQAYTQLKLVTRRNGWWNLTPGTQLQQVVKGMGLKKWEKIQKIHTVEVVKVNPEPLNLIATFPEYGRAEMVNEGFPWMVPDEFVDMFCRSHKGVTATSLVNRIEYKYIDKPVECPACYRHEWKWSEDFVTP